MAMWPWRQRRRTEEDFAREIRAHLALEAEELKGEGYTAAEAGRRARVAFNNPALARERFRLRGRVQWLDDLGRDLRFGLRQLHRSPGFAATAILTLALGLGANTAVFSLINGLVLRTLPVPHAEQLVILESLRSDFPGPNDGFSYPMFRALEKRHEVFADVAGFSNNQIQVRSSSGNVQLTGALVSGQYFDELQTPPLLGRTLTAGDDRDGSPGGYVVVISENLWQSWFNRAPDVVGKQMVIANSPFTVVGVMPRKFIGSDPTKRPDIFLPLSTETVIDAPLSAIEAGDRAVWMQGMARLKPGVSLEQAKAALKASTNAVLEESHKEASTIKNERDNHFELTSEPGAKGNSYLRATFKKPLMVVFALCATMLLLACLNLASLLMARGAARERELCTRLAIGASRRRLMQQLLVENLLIAGLGTVTGLAVSPLVSKWLTGLLLGRDPGSVIDASLDLPVFLFAAVITVLAAAVTGLMPALRATSGDLNEHIKAGGYARSGGRTVGQGMDWHRMAPRILMGLEVALALTLVIGAGLLAASLTRLYQTGLGFEPKGLVNLELQVSKQPLEGEALSRWYQDYAEALNHLPGVKSVTYTTFAPLSGDMWLSQYSSSATAAAQQISMSSVGPRYFETMRIPMLEGREFSWQDTKAVGGKVILNASAAKLLFPNLGAIGRYVNDYTKTQFEVVAVVGDVTYDSIRKAPPPTAYLPMTQPSGKKDSYTAVVRYDGSLSLLATGVRSLTTRMAPEIPAPVMTTMSGLLDASIASERLMAMLSVFFAICALLVTAIGLYGTLAYSTARRTSEIGIRMALGARRLQVVMLVFRENAWSAAGGSVAGLGIALLASRALSSFLYGTSARDPWVLVASVTALAVIASAASLLPAVRAARIDPMEALRSE